MTRLLLRNGKCQTMKKINIRSRITILLIILIPVVLWMALIFRLSSQTAHDSYHLSEVLTDKFIEAIKRIKPDSYINRTYMNEILRKIAHYLEYFVLELLMLWLISRIVIRRRNIIRLSVSVCIFFAVTDELHQIFVQGRGPRLLDIIIDGLGIMTGVGLEHFISGIYYKNKLRKREREELFKADTGGQP